MIHITKGDPISDFKDFVKKEHPKEWEDIRNSKRYSNLSAKCREHILQKEQNDLSAYTEKPLANRKDLHIDHFRKRGLSWNENVSFDWNNLLVDEIKDDYGARYKDNLTNSTDDYALLLNPVVDYPEKLMTYRPDGTIKAREDIPEEDKNRVNFTIERFNLQHAALKKIRKDIMFYVKGSDPRLSNDEVKDSMKDSGFPTVVDWALEVRAMNLQTE